MTIHNEMVRSCGEQSELLIRSYLQSGKGKLQLPPARRAELQSLLTRAMVNRDVLAEYCRSIDGEFQRQGERDFGGVDAGELPIEEIGKTGFDSLSGEQIAALALDTMSLSLVSQYVGEVIDRGEETVWDEAVAYEGQQAFNKEQRERPVTETRTVPFVPQPTHQRTRFDRKRLVSFAALAASIFGVGVGVGLWTSRESRVRESVDRTLVASATFANLMGNDKEIRLSATGGKGRFGIAVGFLPGDRKYDVTPPRNILTRFSGPDQTVPFILAGTSNPIYLVVTDTPAGDLVHRYFDQLRDAGGPAEEPAKVIEKLKEHLIGLGFSTLDIQKVPSP